MRIHPIYGLGLVSKTAKVIRPGMEYDKYFDRPAYSDVIVKKGATIEQIVEECKKIISKTTPQTAKIAQALKASSLDKTLQNIWDFYYNHFKYKEDQKGREEIRSPRAAWASRSTGVDCDCFTTSISTILLNLGIPHILRIVELNYNGGFHHIYVVVPKNNSTYISPKNQSQRSNYWVLDPVVDAFDYEAPKVTNFKDYPMADVHFLNGLGCANCDNQVNGCNSCNHAIFSQKGSNPAPEIKQQLIATRNAIKANPSLVAPLYKPQELLGQIDYVLNNWENDYKREQALNAMEFEEHKAISGIDVEHYYTHGIDGLGKVKKPVIKNALQKVKAVIPAAQLKKIVTDAKAGKPVQHLVQAAKAKVQASAPAALKQKVKPQFFKNVKNAVKNTATKVTSAATKDKIKNLTHKVLKVNPLTVAARNGFLLALKTNFAHMASVLKYSYLSPSGIAKRDYDINEYNKLVAVRKKVENLFYKIGGDPANMKKAIMSGKAGQGFVLDGIDGADGLGVVVTATTIAAASAIIAGVTALLKEINISKLTKQKIKSDELTANDKIPADDMVMPSSPTVYPDGNGGYVDNSNNQQAPPLDYGQQNQYPQGNSPSSPDAPAPDAKQDNTMLYIIGGAAVLAIGYAATSSNKGSKSLNGVEEEPTELGYVAKL